MNDASLKSWARRKAQLQWSNEENAMTTALPKVAAVRARKAREARLDHNYSACLISSKGAPTSFQLTGASIASAKAAVKEFLRCHQRDTLYLTAYLYDHQDKFLRAFQVVGGLELHEFRP